MPECLIYSDLSSSLTLIGNIKPFPAVLIIDILKEQNKKKIEHKLDKETL